MVITFITIFVSNNTIMAKEVEHSQMLNQSQDQFVEEVKWAFRNARKSNISKSKAIQMILDCPKVRAIKLEEFIK